MKSRWIIRSCLLSLLMLAPGISLLAANTIAATGEAQFNASEQFSGADEQGRYVYLIEFNEPGLLDLHRQTRQSGERFDARASHVQSESALMAGRHDAYVNNIGARLQRNVAVSHYYQITHSGIAARLTQREARQVMAMPEVATVERERVYHLDTFAGPEFIGAGSVWDGSATPDGNEYRGENMVAGVLDSGIVPNHPSFLNDPACGHGENGTPDKLLSFVDCASTDSEGRCNGTNLIDNNGHGTHVAGTVAGNLVGPDADPAPLPPGGDSISGVAYCGHIRSYNVCSLSTPTGLQCGFADIQAGMNTLLDDGDVDTMNFSISGGQNPWTDNDRRKLDLVDAGVFVNASAGNTSDAVPNPIGTVNHRGPWVVSVAASTRVGGPPPGEVSVTGPGTPPANLIDIAVTPGSNSPTDPGTIEGEVRFDPDQPAGADGCVSFPADFFDGVIALVERGTCEFTTKINNAAAAGAIMVIIRNNQPATFGIASPGQVDIPAYAMQQAPGDALRNFVSDNPGATARFDELPQSGDELAGFSLRGPTPSPLQNLQKPDITAPGVGIYAADVDPSGYGNKSGTSMSGPHLSGAAMLVRQMQPGWTPIEVGSAMRMTAKKTGTKPGGTTDWDWDDVGSGRIELTRAGLAGLVMHETFANFLAANPASGGDVRTLNLPAVRDMDCSPVCTWTRTVRNTLDEPSSWTVAGSGITANMDITVSPSSFSFTGDLSETQELTITAAPVDDLTSTIGFGEIVFEEAGDLSPELHFTVAIRGEPGDPGGPIIETAPEFFSFVMNPDTTSSQTLNIANIGEEPLTWTIETEGITQAITSPREFEDDFDIGNWTLVNTPEGVDGSFNTNAGPPIELFVIGGDAGVGGTTDFEIVVPGAGEISFDWGFQSLDSGDFDDAGYVVNGNYTLLAGTASQVAYFEGSTSVPVNAGDTFAFRVDTFDGLFGSGDLGITNFEFTPGVCADVGTLSWLSVSPASGTTEGGENDDISVNVDTDGLVDGLYEANLCISSDATNESLVVIPVSVNVQSGTIEPPTIDVDVTDFSFNLISGDSDSDDMVISNIGDELLTWNITTAADSFSALPRGGDIVVFDNINYEISNTIDGSSFNWFTGDICDCDTNPGYNLNTWSNGGNLAFWWWGGTDERAGLTLDGSTYAVLGADDTIGPASTFISAGFSAGTTAWRQADNVDGYLGFRFNNPDTSQVNYGYARITTTGATGYPATVVGWAFDQTGAPITIPGGVVPEGCDNPSSIPWLSASPSSGSLAGGNSAGVSVSVDASGLAGGLYEALLCVNSNDPADPIIEIPVTLDVTGAPEIDVDPGSISMTIEAGDSDTEELVISNFGESLLTWEVDEAGTTGGLIVSAGDSVTIPAVVGGQSGSGFAGFAGSYGKVSGGGQFAVRGDGITITHSDSDDVLAANAVACSPDEGVTTSENAFLRTFTLADFDINDDFNVSEVSFGIENLSSSQPITVNLYSLDGDFLYANMDLVGTATESLAEQQLTVVTVPVEGTISAGGTLVVEIAPPDLSEVAAFFPGTNSAGETAPSYIASAACSINEPATYASIGFPQVQLVMSVTGTTGGGACALPTWVSVNPNSGSLEPTEDEVMTVTLDADGLSFGTYEANICIASNDPVNPLVQVPVTLEVPLGEDAAFLEGTVLSQGYCSADPFPAAGALIEVEGGNGATYSATADANGFYEILLDVNDSPVSVTASAPDHISATETGVDLIAQDTVVVDFDLVLDSACATVDPASLSASVEPGQSSVQMLEIGNVDGAADLDWSIFAEAVDSQAHFPAVPYMAAAGNAEGASLLADESWVAGDSSLAAFEVPLGTGVPAFSTTGFTADGYVSLDALVPGTLNLINATQPTNIFAAAFIDNDFSQQYMLASANGTLPVNTFGVADTSTGDFTTLGTVTGGGAGSWSSMKWDHGTGTLFAVNAAGGNNVLYTIDLDTLAATQVGVISGAGVDPGAIVIAMAISPDGLMYGIDIIADVLLAIDKDTAEASVIGPLGVNANFAQDMDFDQSTGVLYWAGYLGGGNSQMYTVDLATGAATAIGAIGGGNELLSFSIAIEGSASCQAPSTVPWLTIDPLSGTTDAGSTDMVEVVLDSAGLSAGVYEAFICVETDDVNNEQIAVPVTLNVIEDGLFQDRFEQ